MRRTMITAVTTAALAIPGVAVASHRGEHRAREVHHGARQHHKRHHHAHLLRFGAAASNSAASGSSSTPAASADETAGTIASFANGALTITLNDGPTVSGKVTEGTEIECRSAMARAARDGDQGDDNDQGDDRGDDGQSSSGPGDGEHGDLSARDGDDNDANDDDAQDEAEHCTTAALVAGVVVREAELRVSSVGAVWEKVELNR
ncbi:MAG TPA: hypothetical protein VK605_08705 [Solirubrobacteraceae bacterium]|nr:hypothetical protein [Solirubrobacteraceae bacterium]